MFFTGGFGYRLRLRTERVAEEGVDDFTLLGFFTLAGLVLDAELFLAPRFVRDARVEAGLSTLSSATEVSLPVASPEARASAFSAASRRAASSSSEGTHSFFS